MAKNGFHIGKKIKDILDQTPMSVVAFARSINITRNGAYKVFERESIDTAQLQKISQVLKHDFFGYYLSKTEGASVKEGQEEYGYATKRDVQDIAHTVNILLKEFEKLREAMHVKPSSRTTYPKAKNVGKGIKK